MSGVASSRVRGRARAAAFLLGFGGLWVLAGLMQTHRATGLTVGLLAAVAAGLGGGVMWLRRLARALPAREASTDDALRARRMFAAVSIIQWVSIFTAVAVFWLLRMPAYIAPAIAIIVGLHFFPLAGAFHYRQHYVTGCLLIAWTAGCLLVFSRGAVSGMTALGVGLILLGSSASTVVTGVATMRGFQPEAAT